MKKGQWSRAFAEATAAALPPNTATAVIAAMNAGTPASDVERDMGVPKRAALALHGSAVLGYEKIVCNHETIGASRVAISSARRVAWAFERAADLARRKAARAV